MNVLQKLLRYFKPPPEPEQMGKQVQLTDDDYFNPSVRYMIHQVKHQQVIAFSLDNMMQRDFAFHDDQMSLGGVVYQGDENHGYAGGITFNQDNVRWYGCVADTQQIMLDLNIDDKWYQIALQPDDEADLFTQHLMQRLPDKLQQPQVYERRNIRTYFPAEGIIIETRKHVGLHVTPMWLFTLDDERVLREHCIDDIGNFASHDDPADTSTVIISFDVGNKKYSYSTEDMLFVKRLTDAIHEISEPNASSNL